MTPQYLFRLTSRQQASSSKIPDIHLNQQPPPPSTHVGSLPHPGSRADGGGPSRGPVKRRAAWPAAVLLIALHLVAGFYAFQFLLHYWASSQAPPNRKAIPNNIIANAGATALPALQAPVGLGPLVDLDHPARGGGDEGGSELAGG
ncbi:hypothetical protein F5B18DRAFT_652543 [Nemania serpens]|nr:hypothetical protein F5B18DRAFT_652543 [Nemania serpens]